jgi:hypothetical protein
MKQQEASHSLHRKTKKIMAGISTQAFEGECDTFSYKKIQGMPIRRSSTITDKS